MYKTDKFVFINDIGGMKYWLYRKREISAIYAIKTVMNEVTLKNLL